MILPDSIAMAAVVAVVAAHVALDNLHGWFRRTVRRDP